MVDTKGRQTLDRGVEVGLPRISASRRLPSPLTLPPAVIFPAIWWPPTLYHCLAAIQSRKQSLKSRSRQSESASVTIGVRATLGGDRGWIRCSGNARCEDCGRYYIYKGVTLGLEAKTRACSGDRFLATRRRGVAHSEAQGERYSQLERNSKPCKGSRAGFPRR